MTLSLNPTLTQAKDKEQNKEIQVNNIDIVTQHKPMPQLQAQNTADLNTQDNNTESSINTQEPIGQTPNTTQDFDINNKEYQEFVKEFLTTKQAAKDHYDLKYSKDLLKQSVDKFEITQLANPLFIANNIKDMGREGIEFFNKSGDQIKKSETELYDYLAKTGISHEMLGIKNFDEQKLKDAHTRQGLRGKTEYKQLNEEEKDYLKRGQNWAGALWDKVVHSEEERVEELLRNDTRRYIDPDLLTDLIKIDSAYSSVLNVMKSSETATQDLQKKLKEMDIKAKERGYAAAVYDIKAKALAIIDKQGKKYYLNEDSVTANLDKIIVNNWNDILLSSIPVGGWGVKGAQLGAKGAGIALKNAGFKGLGKEAAKAGAISFAASPLDYVTLRKEVGGEIDTTQMLEFSAGNALGSAAGVMAIGTLAKGVGKAYNSIKDLKNLSTDDLKNIKISKYLDNEEASIHRKLAKFNKSEIDSNYEIFKGLQSDRVISKEMKDPTFMGNFMDKISDYNVLKHLSSKKESQDKLLSALFSNKELAREFAGKLTSEEATIVNKAIHAMGENFTRLSREYEQQIIDEYAKSGKIKGLTPHTEMQNRHVETKHETSSLNEKIDSNFTYTTQETKDIKVLRNDLKEALNPYLNKEIVNKETGIIATISTKGLTKISSSKAVAKTIQNGFTRDEHFKVAQDLKSLFENSKLRESHADTKARDEIQAVHRFTKSLQINGSQAEAKITLFENNQAGNKIYSLELESLEKPTPLSPSTPQTKAGVADLTQSVGGDANPTNIAKTDTDIIPQNLPEVYKHMLDEIDKQAKQDYKTSIDNLQNALNDTDFKATLLQGYKQVTDDAIDSLGLDNQLTNTLIRETQKLESKQSINLSEAIELRKNINEIMRNYEKSSSDLKKFRANKHLDNIKDNIDNAIKNALDSKVAQNEAKLNTNVSNTQALDSVMLSAKHETSLKQNTQGTNTLTRQEADELFSNFQQANKNYAQIKESLNDKFAKALTKGMNKKDLDSRLTIEQWKQRVLDTQWGDSVKGLENTIFKNFNPRMQKHTQMLTILRALDRNVKLNDDSMPIDFTKILSDIENLEKLTLHPEIYPILDTFKSYAKSYQFAQEISKAKALENQVGGGALATTLEGRIKVFLTNRLFKKLFAFIPYIGDNAAITKALQSAIKDLKYPSEITLETLKVLNKADLDKGFKPIKDKEPRFEYKAHTPLSDKDLQDQIKGNTQILNPKDTSEIEAIASNPLIQNMERQAKYNEELTQKISQFEANKENIQQDILNNLIVATQEIKQNTELLKQLAQQLTHNNPIHTPNKSIIKAQIDNETYFITTDKNNITAIEKQELQLAQPKTYDELMQRDKNQNATLESYRDQYADIAERKEAEAQKQLLLEYKPEVAKKQEINKDSVMLSAKHETSNLYASKDVSTFSKSQHDNIKDTDLLKNLYGNKQEMRKFVKDKLNAIKGKDIVNKDGIQARLSSVGIAKMSSDKAIQKSLDNGFKVEEHFEAVSNIENLFIQSKFFKSETPKNQSKDIKAVHRFIADNALKDKEAQALITLKESFQNGNRIYSLELEELTHPTNLNRSPKSKGVEDSHHDDVGATQTTRLFENHGNIIPQNPTKAQSEYFNPFMNEYEKIKEIKKLHTQDDNLIRVMKVEGRNDYIEPLSNMSVSKEYLQKQTAQSLKEQITQAILGNQTQLKALQQGYNTYHLSPFQKEILESVLDIANNPTKLKEYKLQGLQKQLNNLNNNEAYHIEKGREYDKSRYAKDREELEKEITALKGMESSTQINKDSVMLSAKHETSNLYASKDVSTFSKSQHDKEINQYDNTKETFTDSYGKTHEIPKEIAQAWKNTFNLKSLDEAYIPNFTPEVKQALDSILQGEDIKLYVGSLVKLMQRDRLEFLPYIKDTLEHSDIIIKDKENAIIFAKDIGQTSYFTSVSKNDKGEWVISTNSYKTLSQLKNRVNDNGEILYISKEDPNILAETFTTKAFSNELANAIIPQTPQEIIKQAKASGKSVKETKELLQKHKKEIQSIRTEIRKDIATRQKNIEQGYIDIVSSHHAKIGKKGGYTTKMYLETDKEKQSYLYDGFNKESVDNYLQLVKENAPLKERNKALDKLVNERLEAEERFRQLQKQQEELEDKQLQAFDEESFIKSLEGKSKDELENIQGDLWSKSKSKNSDIPFPVIARMSNLVMWIKDKIPQAAFNNDELREAIKSLRTRKEYKDDINSIQYFKKNRAYIEQTLNIKPIKEFGTNYAEHYHSGESAIQKLISEAQAHKESGAKTEYKGQVAGAFHRKELGDIDLVWGEVTDFEKHKGYGLAHILDKHPEFDVFNIPKVIEQGKIEKTYNGYNIVADDYIVGLNKGFKDKDGNIINDSNVWVVTSFEPQAKLKKGS